MRILVIGSSVVDEIHQNDKIEIKAGGVFYTVSGLLFSAAQNMQIDLITNFDEELGFYFNPIYSQINLLNTTENNFMPNVKLIVHQDKEREEIYSGFSHSLQLPELDYKLYDAILINMISGIDISLDKLNEIRNSFNGLIYMDIHSLARGFDSDGNRVFRKIEYANDWLNSIDILQCNANELMTIYDFKDAENIVNKILKTGIEYLIVTKGKNGAEVYSKIKLIKKDIPNIFAIKNSVGCGDIFGAIFFSSYISTNDIELSLQKSVKISSNFTQFKNVYEFLDKGQDLL